MSDFASHFLAINHESYDSSTVYGIYSTFDEARADIETRTAAQAANPDGGEYSIRNATIEEWQGGKYTRYYERDWVHPLEWKASDDR